MLSEALLKTATEPYPGLRAFNSDEAHLFFGRDEQIDKLLEKLEHSHFVAVVGPSGCGKSSLVKAGLIPALRTGFFLNVGTKWRVAEMRPGNDPYKNLAKSLSKCLNDDTSVECLKAELKRSPKGLLEVIQSADLHRKDNFLLVVDQFEELFRYEQNNNINEVTGFINLLIDSASQQELPLHIIITMRSDFLGHCSLFLGLPEILNDNQFLTPRLTREQTKEAIEGPAVVCDGQLEPKLVTSLLNDIGIDHDQLPLLQHALMRMWNIASKKTAKQEEEAAILTTGAPEDGTVVLTADYYNEIGRLNKALSQHANEIYDKDLNDKQKKIAEVLFKRLSERNIEQKDNRRIATVEDIAGVAGVSATEVIGVADVFRRSDASFLMPPSEVELTAQSFLDVSHESLLRQWDKMKDWIGKEYEDASLLERLVADSDDYFKRNGELLTGVDLSNVEKWITQEPINEKWASRYSEKFVQVKQYVDKSHEKSRRKRNNRIALYSLIAALVLIPIVMYAWSKVNTQKKLYKAQVIADTQRELALAKAQADAQRKIEAVNIEAEAKGKIALAQGQADAQIEIAANRARAEAQRQIEIARVQADAQRKVDVANAIYNRLHEILALVNEPFYKSGLMDSARRDEYVDQLVNLRYREQKEAAYSSLLADLNKTIALYYLAQKNPNKALLEAVEFNNNSKSSLSDSMLHNIANNYYFNVSMVPVKKIFPAYSTTRSMSAISQDKTLFAIHTGDSVKIFKRISDSLALMNSVFLTGSHLPDDTKTYADEVTGTNTLTFVGGDSIAALIKHRLYQFGVQQDSAAGKLMPNYSQRYSTSTISNDGKKLAIDRNNYNVSIYDIHTFDTINISLNPADGYVENVSFSKDNKTIIVKQRENCIILPAVATGDTAANDQKKYPYAGFTPDGQYVLVQQRNDNFELHTIDKDSAIGTIQLFNGRADSASNLKVTSMALSPNWTTIYIKATTFSYKDYGSNETTYTFNRNDNKPIFQLKKEATAKDSASGKVLQLNYLNNSIVYLANDNVLSYHPGYYANILDTIKVWKKREGLPIDQLADTISAVTKKMEESFENNLLSIDTITDKQYLENALSEALKKDSILLQKRTLYNAKKLTGRLAQLDTSNYISQYRKLSQSYFSFYRDTAEYIADLKNSVALQEGLLKKDSTDTVSKHATSSDYWNLSWFVLFDKKTRSLAAIDYATTGIARNPKNDGIHTNLALGYLLSEQCEKANNIYTTYKGQQYASDEREFTKVFLQDLDDLEAAGIITPSNKKVYSHVTNIRQFLKDEIAAPECPAAYK